MRRLLLFGFASLALLAAGCGGTSTASLGSGDVAVVGSKEVTKDKFQELMARAKKSYDNQKRAFPKPGSTEYEQLKGQAVTFLVQQAEVAEQAELAGVSWSGVSWSGVSWSGVSWSGVSWSGVSWSGVSWS